MFRRGRRGDRWSSADLVAEEPDLFCLSWVECSREPIRASPPLTARSLGTRGGKNMASVETADRDRPRVDTARTTAYGETKASFKTTELLTMLGVVAAILVAAASADNFDAPRAW